MIAGDPNRSIWSNCALCFYLVLLVDRVLPNCQLARFGARAGGGQSSAADDHKSALKSGQGEGGPIFRSGPKGANYVICGLR